MLIEMENQWGTCRTHGSESDCVCKGKDEVHIYRSYLDTPTQTQITRGACVAYSADSSFEGEWRASEWRWLQKSF
jgi:hypothetical protein